MTPSLDTHPTKTWCDMLSLGCYEAPPLVTVRPLEDSVRLGITALALDSPVSTLR